MPNFPALIVATGNESNCPGSTAAQLSQWLPARAALAVPELNPVSKLPLVASRLKLCGAAQVVASKVALVNHVSACPLARLTFQNKYRWLVSNPALKLTNL